MSEGHAKAALIKAWSKRGNRLCSALANYQTYPREERNYIASCGAKGKSNTREKKRKRKGGGRKQNWFAKTRRGKRRLNFKA